MYVQLSLVAIAFAFAATGFEAVRDSTAGETRRSHHTDHCKATPAPGDTAALERCGSGGAPYLSRQIGALYGSE